MTIHLPKLSNSFAEKTENNSQPDHTNQTITRVPRLCFEHREHSPNCYADNDGGNEE